jgi:hypothetical protein
MSSQIKLAEVEEEQSLRVALRRLKRHPAFRVAKAPFDVVKDSVPSALRIATNWFRHLPTTVIVGAQKAGTTQLYAYMVKHPRCFGAAEKEVDYFSKRPDRSVAWYRSRFPLRRRVVRRTGHVIEASPSYLPTPSALRQMKKVLPGARVIVLLRDPVSRAFSHYQHKKTRHVESRSFAQVVDEEIRATEFPARLGVALGEGARPMLGYVSRGYYALQLELLLKVYPRNKVIVIDSANLFKDTSAVCNRVFDFMGLEDFDVEPGKVYNRGFYQEKIDPRVAERLREHYRPYDELLQEIMGQPFGWMTAATPRAMAA